jgi:hypothetical protein
MKKNGQVQILQANKCLPLPPSCENNTPRDCALHMTKQKWGKKERKKEKKN